MSKRSPDHTSKLACREKVRDFRFGGSETSVAVSDFQWLHQGRVHVLKGKNGTVTVSGRDPVSRTF